MLGLLLVVCCTSPAGRVLMGESSAAGVIEDKQASSAGQLDKKGRIKAFYDYMSSAYAGGWRVFHQAAGQGKAAWAAVLVSCGVNARTPEQGAEQAAARQQAVMGQAPAVAEETAEEPVRTGAKEGISEVNRAPAQNQAVRSLAEGVALREARAKNESLLKLLATRDESKGYNPALDEELSQLSRAHLYARVFPDGQTLLHWVAHNPNELHTQGVEKYIAYLSEQSTGFQQACIRGVFAQALPQRRCPKDIVGLIGRYLPSQLDVMDDAGKTAVDYAYAVPETPFLQRSFAYPLLQKYGAHHSATGLIEHAQKHLQVNAPPYASLLILGWQQDGKKRDDLLNAAVGKRDFDLVWLLLGCNKGERSWIPNCRLKTEALINAKLRNSLQPGWSLLGYCSGCDKATLHACGLQRLPANDREIPWQELMSKVCTSRCDSCGKLNFNRMTRILFYKCSYSIKRRYKNCDPMKACRITTGEVRGDEVHYLDFGYNAKGDDCWIHTTGLLAQS